jgi:CBS domain containing-hemolysin-like protein
VNGEQPGLGAWAGPWLPVALGAATSYFATLQHALRGYSRARLEDALGEGSGPRVDRFDARRDEHLIAAGSVRQIASLFLILSAADIIADWPGLIDKSEPGRTLAVAGILIPVLVILSVLVPTLVSRYAGHRLLAASLPVLSLIRWPFLPLAAALRPLDRLLDSAEGSEQKPDPAVIEEEILDKVAEGEQQGAIEETEKEMIEGVFEFGDARVSQIMTPRTEVVAVPATASPAEAARLMCESGHHRLPVYEGNLDKILGLLFVGDVLRKLAESAPPAPSAPPAGDVRALTRPALFIPETKSLSDLLGEFRKQTVRIAVVIDEYGGTSGVVTDEDLLEKIVGDLPDEGPGGEKERPPISERSATSIDADGRVRLDELNGRLPEPIPESPDYETAAGFVIDRLGHIPRAGEGFRHGPMRFSVLEADERKINRLLIEWGLPPEEKRPTEPTANPEGSAPGNPEGSAPTAP